MARYEVKHHSIALYIRSRRSDKIKKLRYIFDFLNTHKIEYFIEQHSYLSLPPQIQNLAHELFTPENVPAEVSLIIVIGGDGSFIHACKLLHTHHLPVTGINLGSLGFLTDISVESLEEQLLPILFGQGKKEKRNFITTSSDHLVTKVLALNDIVVQSGEQGGLIELQIHINNSLAYTLRCDGMIVATSTGSTAYALSAGGPLLHTQVKGLVLVPLAAHNLAARSSVIPQNSHIQIRLISESNSASVNIDGKQEFLITTGESIQIQQSQAQVILIHPPNHDPLAAWRVKLGWTQFSI